METKINLLYGRRSVAEYIEKKNIEEADLDIKEVYVKKNPTYDIEQILKQIPTNRKIHYLSPIELDAKFPSMNHQGIVLALNEFRKKEFKRDLIGFKSFIDLEENRSPILILDRIQDAGNLGNILRTAECFGFKIVVLSEKESVGLTDAVVRVSSGAVHHLEVFTIVNLFQVIEHLKKVGYWIVATSDRGLDPWEKVPAARECAVIMGNEKEGVKRILLDNADFVCNIPMHGNISSLNVVVATGIVLDRIQNR
jgi:23S rRNA (guanosine2251-2'-O)-methyltransferase